VWWAQRKAEEEEETDEDDGWESTHAAPVWKGGNWQDWGGDGHHYGHGKKRGGHWTWAWVSA